MQQKLATPPTTDITPTIYPESDGQPMADNTLQFDTIVKIKTNLDILFKEDVFVAGDLFWYPVKGNPKKVLAPDVMVAFSRPKGYRSSYKQWEEEGIAPAVVFEVLSNSNSAKEMVRKGLFYQKYGVEEFIIVDPYQNEISVYTRQDDALTPLDLVSNIWKSEKLGITIETAADQLSFFYPDGQPFLMPEEWEAAKEQERVQKEEALKREEQERTQKEEALKREEQERTQKEEALKREEQERLEKEQAQAELEQLKVELARLKKK
ncbi:MAG: Uma2 family endonuclease [Bacteroidota bacterium]